MEGPPEQASAETGASLRWSIQRSPDESREYRTRPCARCPWRTDTDLTDFTDQDMAMLRRANGRPGAEAALHAPTVACHLDQPGTAHAWRLCAGWLAVVGHEHLGIRVAEIFGGLPDTALIPGEDWPALYESLEELETARTAQITEAEEGPRAGARGAQPAGAGGRPACRPWSTRTGTGQKERE
jgi:hypothetical protein